MYGVYRELLNGADLYVSVAAHNGTLNGPFPGINIAISHLSPPGVREGQQYKWSQTCSHIYTEPDQTLICIGILVHLLHLNIFHQVIIQ